MWTKRLLSAVGVKAAPCGFRALALAVAALLLAPGAAGAQSVLTPSPAVLQADSLDGASITLQAPAGGRFGFSAALDNRWSASGAPAGVTVTVVTAAEPKLTHGRTRVNLVIRATGNSTRDWNLYIVGTNFAVDGSSGGVSFGPIRVQGPPPGVTLSPGAATVTRELSVTEQGAAATYSVQLGQRPQGPVNVQIQAPAGISTNPSGVIFNTSNWNTARTVTVRALDDANVVGETVRIRHYVQDAQSSSDYRPAPDAYLTVHVTDNDTPTLRVSQRGPMRLTEGGSGTFTVALGQPPTGNVVVDVSSWDADAATVNGGSEDDLTFTTTNWNTAQTVTVAAVHDGDLRDEAVTISAWVDTDASADDFHPAAGVTFAVNVTDDDGLRVVPRAVTVQEDSAADATYTVALKSRPSGLVTVTAAAPSGDATAVAVSPSELVFTTTNWSAGQAVTVTAGSGATDPDAADRTVTLSHAVASAGAPYNYAAQSGDDVTVTIDDDETAAVLLSRSAALALREGATATYTVRLGAPPAAGNVEVRVSSDDAAVTVNKAGGTAAAAQTLTFDASTWSTAQTVTVEAVHDANAAHATVTLTHAVVAASSADEYDDVAAVTLSVGVTDDEGAEIEVSRGTGALALAETGATSSATYTVRLSVVPSAAVTVRVSSGDSGAVTVNGAASSDLSFSTMNWSTGQAVTVTAVTDADATHERVTVRHAVSGGAPEYVATGAVTFPVTVTDTNAGLSVTPRAVTVREGGTVQDTYTVALSVAPSGPVTVTASVASGDTKIALDTDASPQTRVLEFGTTNWNTPQTVTVRATSAADDVDGVNPAPVRITHAVASADAQYNYTERATERVTVTIEDDETPGVRVSRLRMTLQEDPSAGGGTGRNVGTYTMVLTSGISGTGAAVGVRVRSQNRDAVRVRTDWDPFVPGSGEWRVIFSPTNWNVPQTVTVTAQSDPDGRDEEVVLINEYFAIDGDARNQGYINERGFVIETPIPDTTVTVADDETPALVVDTDPGTAGVQTGALEVREGSTATAVYTVALGVVPTAAVTVSVNNGDSSAVTLSPPTLTFTTQNWNTAQTVTATPVADDADGDHERVTVTHTLTGAVEYVPPALPASRVPGVTVAVTDDDAASARIYTSTPSPLVQGSLNGATVGVQVTNTTWAAGVQTTAAVDSYFALDTTVPGLTLGSIASVPTTGTATLNLAYDGTAFDTPRTLKVRVLAAAHAGSGNLVTGAAPVTPTPGLTIAPTTGLRTTESGGTATFTVRLATQPAGAVALTLASSNTDEGTVSPTTMTFAPSEWQTPQTVTLTGVDDDMATPPNPADGTQSYTITLTVDQANTVDDTYDGMAPVSLTAYNQDNEFGLNVSAVTGQATEAAGGTATFTVALQTQPTAAVTVAVASRDTSEGTASPPSLTFTEGATGNWGTAQTVTVTGVDDDVDDGTVTWQVRLDPASGDTNYNGLANVDVDVTTTDDDGAPGVTLALDPASVSENGGISTVTARLSRASGAATTVSVTAVSGAFTVGSGAAGVVVIAAGDTTSTDTALVTAVDNTTDAPDRTATVTATVANDRAAADSMTMAVTGATLTLEDDDAAPGAALALDPASVSENAGVSTVTATLSRPSSEPSTVTVTAVSGSFTVGSDTTITIAAGATTAASDTVLITAVDDSIHQGTAGRSATVTGALANGQGAGAVTGATLTLTDDEMLPTVALVLTPASISELNEVSTVTATLSGPSTEAVTVTVAAAAVLPADAMDFNLSTATTLTIAAGATTSAGVVTVTANEDTAATGSKQVTVSGTAAGGNSVANPANRTLTITDSDAPQTTLALSSSSIAENGGVATVTATLDRQSAAAVTVTVAAAAGANAAAGDFTLSTAATLTFAANATVSAGLVTVTAVNDTTDAPDKSVTVSGTVSDSLGLTNDPPDVTLAITDDDAAPGATLALNPASIAEPSGVSTVTATLSHPSSQPSTVTVTAVSGAYTVGTDATIVIAAGATTAASDTATIRVVDDDLHHGNAGRGATVTAALTNGQGAGAVTGAALTITDDETLPTVGFALSSTSISENGGIATVTATLSGKSSAAATVTVTAAAVASTGAVATDFTQSGTTLTIAAGVTTSTGLVTVTGIDNNLDVGTATKTVTITGTTTGGNGMAAPGADALLITDDDAAEATLVLTPAAITENRGISTVTARLSHPTTEAATLTVAAAAGTNAAAGDFSLSSTTTLTIAAGSTTSTGLVTVTAVDDNPPQATGNKSVTVSATAAGGRGVSAPSNATLVIRDDEFGLSESAVSGPVTEAGGTATFTVRLNTQPSASVSVAVSSLDTTEGRVAPSTLTFTVQNWETAQTVTVTGVDDDVDDGDVAWQVRLDTSSSGDSNYDGLNDVDVDVTTTDNDAAPTVTLALSEPDAASPDTISENGGVATVTATLSHPSSAETAVTVTASPVSPAVEADFTRTGNTLTIAATTTTSTGLVTITARNNDIDADDKTVMVSGTAANSRAAADSMTVAVTDATLTITDDDEKGLLFIAAGTTASVVKVGSSRQASYTVALTSQPTGPVTVAVVAQGETQGDVRAEPSSLTFTMGNWRTEQAVTVTVGPSVGAGGYAAALSVAHRASGGDYGGGDGVTGTMSVSVAGATRIAVVVDASERVVKNYNIADRLVTVTAEAGTSAGIEIDLEGVDAGPPLMLTFSPEVAAATVEEAAGDDFGGLAEALGTARTVVDVRVTGDVSPGLRLCLPVEKDVREAARGRPLLLLRYDEDRRVWEEAVRDGSFEKEGTPLRVCARGVASFSPFAVGYEDMVPKFDYTLTAMVFTVDEAIDPPETLRKAIGGDDTRHELGPLPLVLPPGLAFDDGMGEDECPGQPTYTLCGTPTEEFAERDYTWTATDVDTDIDPKQKDVLEFTIEVKSNLKKARARLAALNRSVLPELSRATWGSVVEAVTGRLESSGAGSGMADTLASALKAREGAQDESGVTWRDVVEGRTFAVALGGGGAGSGAGGGGSGVGGDGSGAAGAVMWGSGSRRSLALDKGSLDWSGDLFAAHVGVDAPLGDGLRGGLAASWIEGEIKYTDRSGDEAVTGVHESRLAAVHPYAGWTGADGSRLWGALGFGEGEIEIADEEFVERFGVQKGGSAFVGVAAGGSVPVASAGGLALALKGSGEATRYSVDDNGLALEGVSVKTHRLRLAAEGSRTWALAGGGTLTPSLEVGARWDGGDGETGAGVELGGGLEWLSDGLSVEAWGRMLAAHEGDVEEWGVSGSARLLPGSGGRGLSFTLSPRWGASESGLARLWDEGTTGDASSGADAGTARLEAELGYGFGVWEGSGLATPHAGFGYGNDGARHWRLGTRFAFGPAVAVGLEAERKEGAAAPEHGAGLELRLRW